MAKRTERTRSGGTHYVQPRKRTKREREDAESSNSEEQSDAREPIGDRSGG